MPLGPGPSAPLPPTYSRYQHARRLTPASRLTPAMQSQNESAGVYPAVRCLLSRRHISAMLAVFAVAARSPAPALPTLLKLVHRKLPARLWITFALNQFLLLLKPRHR